MRTSTAASNGTPSRSSSHRAVSSRLESGRSRPSTCTGMRADNPAKGIERNPEERRTRYLNPDELARLSKVLRGGPVELDVARHEARVRGQPTSFPPKEFELLEALLRRKSRLLTREVLIDGVWGSDYYGDTKTLDVHVKRLRAKLEPIPSEPKFLVTVRGLGYKLDL
jgi:DNA-binding response OmpR family regulator